jgi:cytochrome P450
LGLGGELQALAATAAVTSFLLVHYKPELLLFSNPSLLGTFVQLYLLGFGVWVLWKVILYPKVFSPLRHLPGPKNVSWFNGQFGRIRKEPSGGPMLEWVNTIPNDGLIRYLGILNSERIFVCSPKALSEVLVTNSYNWIKPVQIQRSIGRVLGVGVLLAEGDEHRAQRKALMPAFAFRHVKDLYPVFWDKSREGVLAIMDHIKANGGKPRDGDEEKISVAADQAVIEVGAWSSRITLDIIGVAGMGQDFHAITDPNSHLFQTYSTVFMPNRQAQVLGLLNLFLPTWFVRALPIKRNGEVQAAASLIRDVCRDLIRTKKQKLANKELTDVDILSVALESGGFTDENLVDQLMTFMAAGHETTATAMTWAIYLLCVHPQVQKRLRAEIRANLPPLEDQRGVTSLDIDHMPYLNAVCNEVLRYFPPVPMTLREAATDTVLCGEPIPKGTRVFLAPWATNKDTALWGETADKFLPERWMPDEKLAATGGVQTKPALGGAASNYANMTFLHGPRSCIGQAFAMSEFKCLLSAFVGRLEFELNNVAELDEENVEIKGGITARPHDGMWVRVRVLEGW